MATPSTQPPPDPGQIFEALGGYQRSMAIKGAIELDLFTYIAEGATTAAELASRCAASERGIRILCDYLVVTGLLTKQVGRYGLAPVAAAFLDRRSPACLGSTAQFLLNEDQLRNFSDIAAIVRKGGTVNGTEGNMSAENPVWVTFARSMAPMMAMAARTLPGILAADLPKPEKILDIAAGHGLFGIAFASQFPSAQIVAVDWQNVLAVALENARAAGVADRYHVIPGSAFDADLGGGYDVVLLPNFLHHFDEPTCIGLLKKIHAALRPGGMVATLEMVPNDDRVTPPVPATFSLMMLGTTQCGDAYTFKEFDAMFRAAGFGESTIQQMPFSPEQLILTKS